MKRLPILARTVALAGLAAMLASCKTADREVVTVAPGISHDYRLRHPIAVREGRQTLTVFVGKSRGTLTPSQRVEIGALAPAWRNEATGGFVIEVPVGAPNERAALSVSREIREVLGAAGVPAHSIETRPYRTDDPARLGTIRVNYPKMLAETNPCGLWPEDIGPTINVAYTRNRPHWNHGCATQRNLAAQVANPADLVQPRSETPALTSRRTTVSEKYRKGEGTGTVYPDANKGKISDLQ